MPFLRNRQTTVSFETSEALYPIPSPGPVAGPWLSLCPSGIKRRPLTSIMAMLYLAIIY